MKKPDKNNIGNAGEYYVAYILSSLGCITTITLGRAEKYDILAVLPNKKTIKIQVKTLFDKGWGFRMTKKDEEYSERGLFYIFVRLNQLEGEPEYWVFPSSIVSKRIKESHSKWLSIERRDGKKHKDTDIRIFMVRNHALYPKDWNEICRKNYKNMKLLFR